MEKIVEKIVEKNSNKKQRHSAASMLRQGVFASYYMTVYYRKLRRRNTCMACLTRLFGYPAFVLGIHTGGFPKVPVSVCAGGKGLRICYKTKRNRSARC